MADAIAKLLNATALKAGTVLRVGLEVHGEVAQVVRTSVYDRARRISSPSRSTTAASSCRRAEPEPNPELLTAFDENRAGAVVRGNLPIGL